MEHTEEMILQQMKKWRRHLHAQPELSYEEFQTSEWLQRQLMTFGNFVIEKVGLTSFVATIQGEKAGPKDVVAFRSDMDALPIQEETGLPFSSTIPNVMHACGHDIHMAMLLGLGSWLGANQQSFSNKIKLVFQSAEEVPPGGAIELINSGILADVSLIYGLHIFPNHPVGHLGIASGPITASQDIIEIKIEGKGSHGATPELSIDPILVGAELVNSLHHIVSRNISPLEAAVISFGQFTSGDIFNIIPDTATIKGNVRTTNQQVGALIKRRVEEVVAGICVANNAKYELTYTAGYSPVINDAEATELAYQATVKALGEEQIFDNPQKMVSEDFSAYTDNFPGCFMILGGGEAIDGFSYMNHHPKFDVDEQAMLAGWKVYVNIVMGLACN